MKQLGFSAAILLAAAVPASVQAQQLVPQPEPGPLPTPIVSPYPQPGVVYYGPQVLLPRPTNYSFNGPTAGTVTYYVGTTTYYQPGPGGNRLVTAPVVTPVYGYTPGYYSGYYTPLFFRP